MPKSLREENILNKREEKREKGEMWECVRVAGRTNVCLRSDKE